MDAAIAVLDENNGTEKEIVLSLRKIIDGSIESSDLISAWSKIYNDLGGGNWQGVDPKVKAAAYIMGSGALNTPDCIKDYNQSIGLTADSPSAPETKNAEGLDSLAGVQLTEILDSVMIQPHLGRLSNIEARLRDPSQMPFVLVLISSALVLLSIGLTSYFLVINLKSNKNIKSELAGILKEINLAKRVIGEDQQVQRENQLNLQNTHLNELKLQVQGLNKEILGRVDQLESQLAALITPPKQSQSDQQHKEQAKQKEPKITQRLYADYPKEGYFGNLSAKPNQDFTYEIEVLDTYGDARYAPVQEPIHMQRAIQDQDIVLASGCMYTAGRPSHGQMRIIIDKKGKLTKEGNGWKIIDKAEIHFA